MFQRELEHRQRKFERESKARISLDRARALKLQKEREAAKQLDQRAQEEARLRRLAEEAAREAVGLFIQLCARLSLFRIGVQCGKWRVRGEPQRAKVFFLGCFG